MNIKTERQFFTSGGYAWGQQDQAPTAAGDQANENNNEDWRWKADQNKYK